MSAYTDLEKIKKNCKLCAGIGMVLVDEELQYCKCVQRIRQKAKLIDANIPKQYWDFHIADIHQSFKEDNKKEFHAVQAYIKRIRANIRNGKGLWLWSPPGMGKSTCIADILRSAIATKHKAYFLKAAKVVELRMKALRSAEASGLVDYLLSKVDIIAVEEIEKVYLASEDTLPNTLFFDFLSDLYDSKRALLVTSNCSPAKVIEKFPTYIADRLRLLRVLRFTGKFSGRKLVQANART